MFNLEKADRIYEAKMREDSRFADKFIRKFRSLMPEVYAKTMYEEDYGCHIVDKTLYDEAVSLLESTDEKEYGPKFEFEEINISDDEAFMLNKLAEKSGIYTVPQIFVNEEFIGGCDDLYQLERQNKLDAILK